MKKTHPHAALVGTYQDHTGNLFRVATADGEYLTQQRQRAGKAWEEPYRQEARYVQNLLDFKLFTRIPA